MIQFDKRISLPYDHLFSRNYDYFLLFYKLMIVTFNNFSNIAEIQYSYILDAMIAFLPLIFILYLAIKLYTNKILFLINKRYNATRIFLLTFNSVFAIFFICFNYELQNTANLVFNTIVCFVLSLRITLYFIEINQNKILEGKNIIHQLAYIISARNIEDSNLESDIFKLVLIHKVNCEKITKRGDDSNSRCYICNEQNFTLDNFIRNFYEETIITIEKDNYSIADLEVYNLLKLFYLACFESKNKIKLMITAVRMMSIKNKKNDLLNTNVLIFYDFFMENNKLYDGKFYDILKIYEETSSLLERIIYLVQSIYEYEQIDLDFHIKAEEILLLRNKIKQNFSNFSKYKDIRFDNFSFMIFKKVYESLFNTNIEEYTLDLPDNEIIYLLENHYNKDKFIYINYCLQSETLAVTNASKDLNYLKNKNLEDYFPLEISSSGYKSQFIEKLKLNESDSFIFECLIREKSYNFLIKKVIMKCKIFHSFDTKNLKIIGTYEIKENNFVLLEKDENDPSCAYIRNSSENIAKLLYLPEVFIKYPYNFNHNFYRIFTENNLVDLPPHDLTKKEKLKKKIIELNYSYHCAFMSNLVSAFQGYENDVDEKMRLLKEKAEKKVVTTFTMKEVQSFKSDTANYILLSVRAKKDPKSIKSLHKYSEEDIQYNLNDENNSLSLTEKREESLYSLFDSNNSMSRTSSKKNITAPKRITYKSQKLEKFRQNMNNSSNLTLLNVLIIILVCVLIAYNLIILFLITQNNSNLFVVHSIRQDYLALKANFYSMYNNVFNGLYLYNDNQTEVIELFNSYYQYFNKNPNNTFNFNDLTNEELVLKFNIQQSMIQLLQNEYYSSFASKDFDAIFNSDMVYYSISSTNGIIQLNNKNMSLFDSMQTFMNLAKIISQDNFLFVYVIHFKDGIYDFSNINGRDLNDNQIYAMELVINFVNYYKMLEYVQNQLYNYFTDKIDYNYEVFLYFTISLEAIHVVFVFICFLQVNSLSRLIDQFTYFISKLMKDNKIKKMKEKFKCLENLNDLYREDPKKYLKLLKGIKEMDSEMKKSKTKSAKNFLFEEEKNKKILSLDKYLKKNKMLEITKKAILYPLIIFIVIIFSFYYTFSFIFQIAISNVNQDFHYDNAITQRMTANMNNLINNFNLAQVMFLTNNTDNSLYNIIAVNGTSGTFSQPYFIRGTIDVIASETISIETSIKNNKAYSTIALDQGKSVNCTSMYNLVNEPFILALNQSNPDSNYSIIEYYMDICTESGVYNQGMDNLINEINYRLSNYLFYYEEQNFNLTNVIAVYNLPTFTQLYIAVNFIYLPLQKYLLDLTVPIMNSLSNTFSTITTIFIVANIIFDLVILFLMFKRLISGSSKMRQYLYNILEVMIEP